MAKKRVGNFRSNILGGFNRRDVIGYIERLHKKLSDLQEENELLRSKLLARQPEDKDGIESQIDHLESESEEGESNKESDDSEPSLDIELYEEPGEPAEPDLPDEEASQQHEDFLPDDTEQEKDTDIESVNQMSPVQNETEQKAEEQIDASMSNDAADSPGQSVSASKKTIKVRKKTKR